MAYDFALKCIAAVPTCPKSWGVHLAQAPLMAAVRPAQWLVGGRHNSYTDAWSITAPGGRALQVCRNYRDE